MSKERSEELSLCKAHSFRNSALQLAATSSSLDPLSVSLMGETETTRLCQASHHAVSPQAKIPAFLFPILQTTSLQISCGLMSENNYFRYFEAIVTSLCLVILMVRMEAF